MKMSADLVLHSILLRVECLKALFHTGIVDAQELVLRGGHVDKIRLTLAAFLSRNWYTGSSAGDFFR